jgi:hypothetical protein
MNVLSALSTHDLERVGQAIRRGRLNPPFTAFACQSYASKEIATQLAEELQTLAGQGFQPAQIATCLEWLIRDRCDRLPVEEAFDLVTTGPECGVTTNRDTSVVVRELFAEAQQSVLVSGYAVYGGKVVFQELAERMRNIPGLQVQLFLDIHPQPDDAKPECIVVREFAQRFFRYDWPEDRPRPAMYYYPLSFEPDPSKRACLHSKCVVIDQEKAFISSANFTEAAQNRNIEMGLLIHNAHLARKIITHFQSMLESNFLKAIGY